MLPSRIRRLATLVALVGLVVTLPACSDDGSPSGPGGQQDAYVGTWDATSFQALGMDAIAMGMTLRATLTTSTYTLVVTGDQIGVCGEGSTTDCTTNGPFSATASQVTIDAGEPDSVTFDYSISGTTMTWTGDIDGNPVTVTFSRVS